MANSNRTPADFIVPLDMNGLAGRMLHIPAPLGKKAEILLVYGQHSSLERWWGLTSCLSHYGAVTAPDLPGIGGMESFYKIGKNPTLDNFADYLAAFMKMRYKRKKVVIIGMSFGFVVATRMLQRYPELKQNVTMLVSLVGFAHADDFSFSKRRFWFYKTTTILLSYQLPALFFRYVCLSGPVLRATYHRIHNAKSKFAYARTPEERVRFMEAEVWLWQHNDVRTHARTTLAMFALDNCRQRLEVPLWHVMADGDQYLNSGRVEQHLRIVFPKIYIAKSKLTTHAPSIIADEKAAAPLIPLRLRRALSRL